MGLPTRWTDQGQEVLDWTGADAVVRTWTSTRIETELAMLRGSLAHADATDRENAGIGIASGHGGLYRDEISVLRQEIGRRLMKGAKCGLCGK
jgi:hypothetical protein